MLTVSLPWPPLACWPNKRPHWRAKADATRKAKAWAHAAALGSGASRMTGARWSLTITAHPIKLPQGGGNPPDDDNIIAACKGYRDGIADALGVSDAAFEARPVRRGDRIPHGGVVITLEPIE